MKNKNFKVLILILLLVLYETFMYLITKLTPMDVNLIGNYLDNKIPFVSQFVYAYISWYAMLFIIPYIFYKKNVNSFNKYYIVILLCITLVSFIYMFYPTTINRADILLSGISGKLVNLIYKIDTPVLNCFPSMHCLVSFVFIYISLGDKNIYKYLRIFIVLWSVLVILSTLFIKQHVLVDVISAFVLSILVYKLVGKIKFFKDFYVINH